MPVNIPLPQGLRYPFFEPNQVLKDSDLNQITSYLSQQQRSSRTHLIGMGIVCGLKLSYNPDTHQIHLSAGVGLSSEGHLLETAARHFTHYRAVQIDRFRFRAGENASFTQAAPSSSVDATDTEKVSVFELGVDHDASTGDDWIAVADGGPEEEQNTADFLADKIGLLLIEFIRNRRDACLVDCDDKGQDVSYRLRVLMLPRSEADTFNADELLAEGYPTGDLPSVWAEADGLADFFHSWYRSSRVEMQRFGPTIFAEGSGELARTESVDLTHIKQLGDYLRGYYAVCRQAIADLGAALTQLHRLFSPFFTPMQIKGSTFDGFAEQLHTLLDGIVPPAYRQPGEDGSTLTSHPEDQLALQYFYDYLLDLIAAYDELREAAFDLMADCPPDTRRFPTYLMLGPVIDATEVCDPPSIYRSHFVQPPIYNENRRRLAEVRHLHERLRRLCYRADQTDKTVAFTLLPYVDTPIKLTPSQGRRAPLSERAIPFYHRYEQVYRYWSYDECRKGRPAMIPSYFKPSGSEASDREWLRNIDQYPFFRVEGHIGRESGQAIEAIVQYQRRYNLPFDVIALKLTPVGSREEVRLNGQFDDLEIEYGKLVTEFRTLHGWYTNWFFRAASFNNPLVREIYNLLFQNGEPVKLRDLAFPSEAQDPDELTGGSRSFFSYLLWLAQSPDNYHWAKNGQEYRLFLFDADVTGPLILTDLQNIERPIARIALEEGITLDEPQTAEEEQALEAGLQAIIERLVSSFGGVRAPRFRSMNLADGASNVNGKYLALGFWDTGEEGEAPEYVSETINGVEVQIPQVLNSSEVYANDQELYNDYPEFETLYRLLQEDAPLAANQINYYGFMTLARAYRDRLDQLLTTHTFHGFAAEHPGMEHLAGVPAGGTLILVYAEESDLLAQSNQEAFGARANEALVTRELLSARLEQLVLPAGLSTSASNSHGRLIADFALPYRSTSDGLNVAYVVTPPKPVILLDRMVFCKGASPSTFILDPPGGNVSGVGVVGDANGQPAFDPSLDEVEPGLITFTYVVDGTFDTLTVRVYPRPLTDVGLVQSAFCVNEPPVDLTLSPGIENAELARVLIDGSEISQFNPQNYADQDLPTDVNVQLVIRDPRSGCEATTERTLTVYPLPDAGFSFDPPSQDGGFCIDADVVNLIPDTPDDSQGFTVIYPDGQSRNESLIDLSLVGEITSPTTVSIDHRALSSNGVGCEATSQQTVTIFPLPDAAFTLDSDPNEEGVYEFCAEDESILISTNTADGEFDLQDQDGNNLSDGVLPNPWRFSPNEAFSGGAEAQTFTLIRRVAGSGGCEAQSQVSIIVYPETQAGSFEAEILLLDQGVNSFQLRVFNVQSTGNNQFTLNPPPPDGQSIPPSGGVVTYPYRTSDTPDGIPLDTIIDITLTVEPSTGICSSASTVESVRVPFGVEATFLRWDNDGAIEINLNNEPTINIQDLNASSPYSIDALPFPREVGSVIIYYRAPDSDEINSGPLNSASNYRLQLPSRPAIGLHTVRVETFSESGGNGEQGGGYTTTFRVNGAVIFGEEDAETRSESNPAPLLNQRAAARRQQLDDLSQDNSSLANSKSYKQAQLFLMLPIDAAEGDLLKQAQEAAEKLINSYQRANQANQPAYAAALTLVLQATLDRLLMQGEVSEAAQETFAQLNERLAKAELDPKPIQRGWEGKALEAAFDPKQVKAVEKLLG